MSRIVQFDSKGNAVAVYDSLLEAEEGSGVDRWKIDRCLRGAADSVIKHGVRYTFKREIRKEDLVSPGQAKREREEKKTREWFNNG